MPQHPHSSDESFPGYPRGWFVVALSEELEVGVARRLQYFGRELVAYRTTDGTPTVLEAYCPHLGAHLGVGGTVVDDCIRCPFHAWRFNASGACVEVPYARSIPKQARLAALRTIDRNGLVFVHYAENGEEPTYEIPAVPAVGDPTWTPFKHSILRIRTHSREIVENVVDSAHFEPVHRNVPSHFENEFRGHLAIQRNKGHGTAEHADTAYEVEATYYGPGFQVTGMNSVVETLMYNAHTMVDEEHVDLRFGVMIRPRSNDRRFSDAYVAQYVAILMNGFRQDVKIWETKRWRERPILVDGDGPIQQLRRWYSQFY